MARARKFFIITAVVLICLVSCFFIFRGTVLRWAFAKVQTHVHDRYKATLSVSSIEFSGINHISLKGLTLQPDGADTFLHVDDVAVDLSYSHLLSGKLLFKESRINGVKLSIYNEPQRNNIKFLFSHNIHNSISSDPSISIRSRVNQYQDKLMQMIEMLFEVRNAEISYQDTMGLRHFRIPQLRGYHGLGGEVIDLDHQDTITFSVAYYKDGGRWLVEARNSSVDSTYIPFLDHGRGLKIYFKEISAGFDFGKDRDTSWLRLNLRLKDFHVNHWRLANEDVILPQAWFKGVFKFTDDALELDSSSVITMNKADCRVYARYGLLPDTTFALALHMPETVSDSFFQSLPAGMFGTLRGISCTGTLKYDLTFEIHTNNPDSLLFNSALTQKGLRIDHFGADNYTRMNSDFTYEAYDKDRLVRRLTVGPENPFFTRLDQMSPYLPQAVLQAEDPFFMHHRGFLQESFRESIAKNYKEHRFARGGSTISMQLVKNVFLSRDKTVSRKAEEALIVYLIENLGLVPKERMLEVYLNVIEWGPNVYGIGEAARFYFNKKPSALSLQESLFLASIIPRPKSFQWQFDKQGKLRESMSGYFKILTERMVLRNVLNPNDTIGLRPEVTLRGTALHMVMPSDSIPRDNGAETEE